MNSLFSTSNHNSCLLKTSQNILETFIIPKLAANNYLFRLKPALDISKDHTKAKNDVSFNRWPHLLSIDALDLPAVQQCPHDLHMLVWGASRPLRARIFHSSSAHYFHPVIGRSSDALSGINQLHEAIFSGSGYPMISQLLAEIHNKGTKANVTNKRFKIPNFAEVTIVGESEYLFIPNNYLVSFYPSDISEENNSNLLDQITRSTEERTSHLFQTCFVDASNLNRFKEALEFSSKISKVDEVMLESLISGSVDIRMERYVTDSTLFNLLNGPANIRVMQSVMQPLCSL